jgi:membrane-bound lytic murein transglycosylase D
MKLVAQVENFRLFYPTVVKIFKEEGLPEELALLAVVESNADPSAVSRAGAAGLWQLMPSTARRLGLRVNRLIDERFDVEKSTRAAAKYLKELYSTFKRWDLAIAAYNAGPGRIKARLKRLGADEFWDLTKLPDETLNYVPKFYAVLSLVKEKGLLEKPSRGELLKVKVATRTSLYRIARKLKVPFWKLYRFNRQFKRRVVPGGYYVYVPSSLVGSYSFLKASREGKVFVYVPKRAERLTAIARSFGVSPELIKRVNRLKRNVVYRGETLLIVKATSRSSQENG